MTMATATTMGKNLPPGRWDSQNRVGGRRLLVSVCLCIYQVAMDVHHRYGEEETEGLLGYLEGIAANSMGIMV